MDKQDALFIPCSECQGGGLHRGRSKGPWVTFIGAILLAVSVCGFGLGIFFNFVASSTSDQSQLGPVGAILELMGEFLGVAGYVFIGVSCISAIIGYFCIRFKFVLRCDNCRAISELPKPAG